MKNQLIQNVTPRERSSKPIDAGVSIGHVHLKTADIDRVHSFYVGVLGFNTWESKGGNPPPPGTTGLYHVAIKYPTRAALGDAFRRLAAANWPLDGYNDHGTHEALYLSDPDGNGLELAWDRPEDQWPRDQDGHLTFGNRQLDLDGLFKEGADQA